MLYSRVSYSGGGNAILTSFPFSSGKETLLFSVFTGKLYTEGDAAGFWNYELPISLPTKKDR